MKQILFLFAFAAGMLCAAPAGNYDPEVFAAGGKARDYTGVLPPGVKTVAIITPASYPGPKELLAGIDLLRKAGYKVKIYPNVLRKPETPNKNGYAAIPLSYRLADFEAAWRDKENDMIICSRGGYGTEELIDNINWAKLPRRSELYLLGFSDVTMLVSFMISKGYGHPLAGPTANSLPGLSAALIPAMKKMLHGEEISLKLRPLKPGNASGKVVQMKGMSFGWNSLWPRFYNAGAVDHVVRDWNAEVVRAAVGVEIDNDECKAPCYLKDPSYGKESACAIVDAAIENGVYVLVDWHAHGLHPEAAVEFFTYMADRYKGVPNVIYEICNEPSYKDHEKQIDYTWAEIKEYSLKVIEAIRAIEKDAVIVVGTPRWSQNVDDAADDPITGYDNLMYTLHFYAGTHKEWLRQKGDYAMSKGLALFVTECGGMNADGQGPVDEESTMAWVDWMEDNDISYLFWSISDKKETCSMLYPSASSEGPWAETDLSPWGKYVKEQL